MSRSQSKLVNPLMWRDTSLREEAAMAMQRGERRLWVCLLLCAWILLVGVVTHAQALQQTVLADGSTIGLPARWVVTAQHAGSLDARGPRGEGLSLGAALSVYSPPGPPPLLNYRPAVAPCCDPVRATVVLAPQIAAMARAAGQSAADLRQVLEAQPVAVPRAQAAYLLSELDMQGHRILHYSYVLCAPTGMGQWMYYISEVGAPESVFRDEFPLLIAIWKSWSVNPEVEQQRLQHAIEANKEASNIYQSAMQHSRDAHQKAACATDDLVRGQIEIVNPRTGKHRKVPNDTANRWIDAGWEYVPASQTTCNL